MTLGIRKLTVLSLIGLIFVLANTLALASWLHETGAVGWAINIRSEYLTGTAITIIVVLLILLVSPARAVGQVRTWVRRCPVCDHTMVGLGKYCSECGSKA